MPSRLLALGLLALTACGNGGSQKAMTKDEYVTAANAICREYDAKAEAIAEPKNADEFVSSMLTLVDLMEEGHAKLRKLTPPPELKAEITSQFLTPNDQQAAALRAALPRLETAARSNDMLTATTEFAKAFQETDKIAVGQNTWAVGFGLTECAS